MADRTYIFEDFKMDPTRRLLSRLPDGQPVTLTHKAFQVLLLLVENRGEVVTKGELMSHVWQDSFVEEGNLTQTVSVLRKALGENPGQHRFIVTESGKGYRFVAPVITSNGTTTLPASDIPQPGDHASSGPESTRKDPQSRKVILIPAVLLVVFVCLVAAYLILNRESQVAPPPPPAREVTAIAVLPFTSVQAKDDDGKLLGAGMAEAVIARLSHIRSVVVRQTSSVARYSDATPEAVKLGREMNVDAVLEGTIQRADERIRVSVRLFRVGDGSLIWAETFDERETDIFSLQDTISDRVARSLSLQLTSDERDRIAQRSTDNLEAYHLYLKGRYFWNRRTGEDLVKSIRFYEQAIAKDPNYALAYSGIAESFVLLQHFDRSYDRDPFPKARRAAEKALSLDENLAEAHTALALYRERYEWDWNGAEAEFRKAIAANPNYATAHQWFGEFLAFRGRTSESVAEVEIAYQLDPLSLSTNTAKALPYLADRRYEEVLEKLKPALELDADFPQALFYMARAYEGLGRYGQAIVTYERAIAVSGRNSYFVSSMINGLVRNGDRARAERTFDQLLRSDETEPSSRYIIARSLAALGRKEEALTKLEDAVLNRDPLVAVLSIDPNFDEIREDARFRKVLTTIGF